VILYVCITHQNMKVIIKRIIFIRDCIPYILDKIFLRIFKWKIG